MVSPRIYHTRKQNVTTNEQVPALNSRDLGSKHRFLQSFVNAADNEQEESGGDFIQHVRSKSLRCYVGAMMFSSFTITKILLEHHVLAESQLELCPFAGKLDKDEEIVFTSDDVENLKEDVKATQCSLIGSPEGVGSREIATITDLCNDADLPEVEILSLIEEQIPKYRLRADTITDFKGYENQDWIQTPVLPLIDDADLTPELIEEVLKYFVLCGDRLTQMTKTYNDVEAVTRLLEEKERDLELAARIGQTLLEKNKVYEDKNETLEELLAQANERINQLRHDLCMKEELVKFYTQNYENTDSPSTPEASTLSPGSGHMVQLQKKVRSLEDENLTLKLETSTLKSATDNLEEKEQKLVNDCVQQLEDVHQQLALFAKELSEKTEECSSQREEITSLLSQIVSLQKKVKTLTMENMDYQKTLEASLDSQKYLTRELADVKEKNEELREHLEETKDELYQYRNKDRPQALRHNYLSSSIHSLGGGESLASELERSLGSEIDYPRGYSPMERRRHNWKIFETAKAAKKANHDRLSTSSLGVPESTSQSLLSIGEESGAEMGSVSARSSMYLSDGDGESGVNDGYSGDLESLYGGSQKLGRPGIPGSNDLQTALRRLSLRRANELNEMDFRREERERQTRERVESETSDRTDLESSTPGRCQTPDSMFSAVSGYMSMGGSSNNSHYRMPEKLQIVKPLEGSATLRQWQQLATPHLGGIFESRPGVKIKGEKKLDIAPEVYSLSDYEEDDEDLSECPTRFQECPGVYTYTNSVVKHPSETARCDSMLYEDDSDVTLTDEEGSVDESSSSQKTSTPKICTGFQGDRSGTSTYSMSQGLAAILNERDLLKTPPEGTVPKSIGGQGHAQGQNSNPPRFPSLISDTHFSNIATTVAATSLTCSSSAFGTMTTPSTFTPRLPLHGSRSHTAESSEIKTTVNEQAGSNVVERLKNTGFTIYGYLAGATPTVNTSRPSSLPVRSSSTVTMATTTLSTASTDSLVTAGTSTQYQGQGQQGKGGLGAIFTHNTAGGVIGALANFKRNGIL